MINGHLFVAYHGCDVTTRDALVTGEITLESSQNDYDWLGPGVYFYEGDADRAKVFATRACKHPEYRYTAKPVATPAVVGAVLCVHHTLDVTTREGLMEFAEAYDLLKLVWQDQGTPESERPRNVAPNSHPNDVGEMPGDVIVRKLDNAVFKILHGRREDTKELPYQMVRGAFRQGPELAPNSGLHRDSHVQVAVRDMSCIRGWFLPPGEKILTEHARSKAHSDYAKAVAAYGRQKTRVRA